MSFPDFVRRRAAGEIVDEEAALAAAESYFQAHPEARKFLEARAMYEDTMHLLRERRLTRDEATARLNGLRVLDADGQTWTIGARSAAWYEWRDGEWRAARPAFVRDAAAAMGDMALEAVVVPAEPSASVCAKCGAAMGSDAKFCANCGAKL